MLTSEIVATVMAEGVDQSSALAIVNEVYYEANARARWTRSTASLGTTVSGQSNYALPDGFIDLDYIRIGSTIYQPSSQQALWDLQAQGITTVTPLFAPDWDTAGVAQIELYPAPTVTGTTIETLHSAAPAALTLSPDTTPVFPADLHGPIFINGAFGRIRARVDERMWSAQYFDQAYQTAVEELKMRATRRVGGDRPRMAALVGRDFTI